MHLLTRSCFTCDGAFLLHPAHSQTARSLIKERGPLQHQYRKCGWVCQTRERDWMTDSFFSEGREKQHQRCEDESAIKRQVKDTARWTKRGIRQASGS